MAEEKIIIQVTSNISEQKKIVDDLRLAILNLRDEQARQLAQAKDEGATAEQINRLKVEQKNQLDALNTTLKEETKQLKLGNDIENSQADTIKRTKAELAKVTDEWNRSFKVNGQNSEATKKLAAEKLRLTEILKNEEKATGDTRRNVGNYTEGIKEAFKETNLFSKELEYVTKAKNVYNAITKAITVSETGAATATGLFSGALKILKIALISTGVGAIVVALGSLVAYFVKSEEGSIKLSKAMNVLGVVFKNIGDVAMNLGGALSALFTGDLTKANEKFNAALNETNNLLKDTNAELEKANQIVEDKETLEDIEIGNIRVIADLERDVAQLRLKTTELRNKDAKAALAANQEAINKQKAIMSLQENELSRRYEIAKAERELTNQQSANYDDLRKAENEAYAALQQAKQTNFEAQKKLYKEQNTLEKEIAAESAETVKKSEEEKRKAAELTAEVNRDIALDSEKIVEELYKDESDATQKQLDKFVEIQEKQADVKVEKAIEAMRLIDQLNSTEISRLYDDYLYKKELIEKNYTDEVAAKKALEILEKQYNKNLKEISRERLASELAATADIIGQIGGLFEQDTVEYKVLASAQALINTYLAATSAYAAMAKIDPIVAAPLAAAAAITSGLINVAKINDIKFAEGGILQGLSHEQGGVKLYSKSGSYYGEAEGGEVILTKNVSKSPELLSAASKINVAAGGKALYAASGAVIPQSSIVNNIQPVTKIITQPVLVVQDVTEIQNKLSRVRAMAVD